MESDTHGQRWSEWFLWKEGASTADIHRRLQGVCGDHAPGKRTVYSTTGSPHSRMEGRRSHAIWTSTNRCHCSEHQARQRCDLGKSALVIHPDGGSPWHWSPPTVDHCAQAPPTAQVVRSLGPETSDTAAASTPS